MPADDLVMRDQILVPTASGLKAYPLLNILGLDNSILTSYTNFGMPPLHFITQRGPFQDGETPLDMRYDTRTIQIAITDSLYNMTRLADRRWFLVERLRPSRSFNLGSGVTPLIYRRWLPGGEIERGTDITTINGSTTVTSARGKFVHNGLTAGMSIELTTGADAGVYQIGEVKNDYTLIVDTPLTADATNIQWRYVRGQASRDLYCLMETGPTFDNTPERNANPWAYGYTEVLRFVAHNPFWYGPEQYEDWGLLSELGDLVFDYPLFPLDECGAWFGATTGIGRWLFAEDFIGQQVSVRYWGHEQTFPTIEINGPAENPVIENSTLSVSIALEYTIALGETVVIDVENKSVYNNSGTNLFQYITGDLATFALSAEPQAPGRVNSISITFDGGTGDSSARLIWRNKYSTV